MLSASLTDAEERILDTDYLVGTPHRSRASYWGRTVLVSAVFVCVLTALAAVISQSYDRAGFVLGVSIAWFVGRELFFGGYRRFESDWDYANSLAPVLPIHTEAAALRENGDETAAVQAIWSAFQDRPHRMDLAIDALRRLGGEVAASELFAIASRKSAEGISGKAAAAFGECASPSTGELLAKLLASERRAVRISAIVGLCNLGTPSALEAIERRRSKFGFYERYVRRRAAAVSR